MKKLIWNVLYFLLVIYKKKHMEQLIIDKYLASLSQKQMKAYLIAKSHLGMSFSLEKSAGFIEWYTKNYTITI